MWYLTTLTSVWHDANIPENSPPSHQVATRLNSREWYYNPITRKSWNMENTNKKNIRLFSFTFVSLQTVWTWNISSFSHQFHFNLLPFVHFIITPFLISTLKSVLALGMPGNKSISLVILSRSSSKYVLKCDLIRGYFWFHSSGQPSTYTLFFLNHANVICGECGFALHCLTLTGNNAQREYAIPFDWALLLTNYINIFPHVSVHKVEIFSLSSLMHENHLWIPNNHLLTSFVWRLFFLY